MLAALSTPDSEEPLVDRRQSVTYPTSVSRQTEVNSLLTRVSNTNPQSWMTTLTKYVSPYPVTERYRLTNTFPATTTGTTAAHMALRPVLGCTTRSGALLLPTLPSP